MTTLKIWRRGARECVLRVPTQLDEPYHRLEIVDGGSVIRSESVDSADVAMIIARIWATESRDQLFGVVPL